MVKKQVYVCEVCGKTLFGVPIIVEIAGHRATTCPSCARRIRGEQLRLMEKAKSETLLSKPPTQKIRRKAKLKLQVESAPQYELIEDFGSKIKRAREDLGLKIEHIARAINIKASTLSKIEAGKIIPSYDVARALERVLDIKIIVKGAPDFLITGVEQPSPPPTITLGELVSLKKKRRE